MWLSIPLLVTFCSESQTSLYIIEFLDQGVPASIYCRFHSTLFDRYPPSDSQTRQSMYLHIVDITLHYWIYTLPLIPKPGVHASTYCSYHSTLLYRYPPSDAQTRQSLHLHIVAITLHYWIDTLPLIPRPVSPCIHILWLSLYLIVQIPSL